MKAKGEYIRIGTSFVNSIKLYSDLFFLSFGILLIDSDVPVLFIRRALYFVLFLRVVLVIYSGKENYLYIFFWCYIFDNRKDYHGVNTYSLVVSFTLFPFSVLIAYTLIKNLFNFFSPRFVFFIFRLSNSLANAETYLVCKMDS